MKCFNFMARTTNFRMLTLCSALLLTLLLASSSQAQERQQRPEGGVDRQRGQDRSEQRMARLKTELELTDKQAKKLKPILDEQSKAMRKMRESMREGGGRPSEEQRKAMRELRSSTHAKVAKVLDKKQLAKFDELNQQRRGGRRGGGQGAQGQRGPGQGGGRPPGPPGD